MAFLLLRTASVLTDHSLHATFFVPRVFEANVEWMLRTVYRQPRKFLRWREHGCTMNCAVIISDTSFKVDDTIFDWLNTDFTGVVRDFTVYIALLYKALGHFLLSFDSSFSFEKNHSWSLEEFLTICFIGIIGLKRGNRMILSHWAREGTRDTHWREGYS